MCLNETSDLTMSITVLESKIRGSAQIRTKNSDSEYTIDGEQVEIPRLVECKDALCDGPQDCQAKLNSQGESGKSKCIEGQCAPCFEKEKWNQIKVTFRDENVQIPDPLLELWRYGDQRMEGTVKSFCADEAFQLPQVKVDKD